MTTIILMGIAFDVGFVVSIYAWPKVKVWVNGAYTEARNLEAKAAALRAKL